MVVGSYNQSELVLEFESPPCRTGDGEFSDEAESSLGLVRRSNSGKFASSFPSGGFDLSPVKPPENVGEVEAKKSLQVRGKPIPSLNYCL